MDKFNITKEELVDLLGKAFDKGWEGYLDLKESAVTELAEEFVGQHLIPKENASKKSIENPYYVDNRGQYENPYYVDNRGQYEPSSGYVAAWAPNYANSFSYASEPQSLYTIQNGRIVANSVSIRGVFEPGVSVPANGNWVVNPITSPSWNNWENTWDSETSEPGESESEPVPPEPPPPEPLPEMPPEPQMPPEPLPEPTNRYSYYIQGLDEEIDIQYNPDID
jgi:hypothetical protein